MEQQNDAEQSRHDVDLVGDVGLVGRDDRDAEHVLEARREHREPHQRPHQRGEQPPALLDELDDFPRGQRPEGAADMGGAMSDFHGVYLFKWQGVSGLSSPNVSRSLVWCRKPSTGALATT